MTEEELDKLLTEASANLLKELDRVIDVPARLADILKNAGQEEGGS